MGSPSPCQHHPAPNPASAPLPLLPVHDGGGCTEVGSCTQRQHSIPATTH